jgi:HEAT repeat protein
VRRVFIIAAFGIIISTLVGAGLPAIEGHESPENRVLQAMPEGPVKDLATDLLTGRHSSVKQNAAARLFKLGPRAEPAIPALVLALGDSDDGVRSDAASALAAIGKPSEPAVIRLLASPAKDDRIWGAITLGRLGLELGGRTPAPPALIDLLKDKSPEVRKATTAALGDIRDPRAVRGLLALIAREEDRDIRADAICSIGCLGKSANAAIPVLERLLEDRALGNYAASSLGSIGNEALPRLVPILADPKAAATTKQNALAALRVMVDTYGGGETRDAFGPLVECLKSDELSGDAISVFHSIGSTGKPMIPSLTRLMTSAEPPTRIHAALAFAKVDHADPRPAALLIGLLGDQDAQVRARAAHALGSVGEAAAVRPLDAALHDRSGEVRENAAWALRFVGPGAVKALPTLRELAAKDLVARVRNEAKTTIECVQRCDSP